MELIKVNHVITSIKAMLQNLVDTDIISGQDMTNLLPVVLQIVLKNESVDVDIS